MARSSTSFGPNNNANPSGRPPRTREEIEATEFLRTRTLKAARRLVELQGSDAEKLALGAVQTHLKICIGELERVAGKDGENVLGIDFRGWTAEQVLDFCRSGK